MSSNISRNSSSTWSGPSTPSNKSSSSVKKRDSWFDDKLKQTFLEQILEDDNESSSPFEIRSRSFLSRNSRSGSVQSYQAHTENLEILQIQNYRYQNPVDFSSRGVAFSLVTEQNPNLSIFKDSVQLFFDSFEISLDFLEFPDYCSEKFEENCEFGELEKSQRRSSGIKVVKTPSFKGDMSGGYSSQRLGRLQSSQKMSTRCENVNKIELTLKKLDINAEASFQKEEAVDKEINNIKMHQWDIKAIIDTHQIAHKLLKNDLDEKFDFEDLTENEKKEFEETEKQKKEILEFGNFFISVMKEMNEFNEEIENFNGKCKQRVEEIKRKRAEDERILKEKREREMDLLKMRGSEIPAEKRWRNHSIFKINNQDTEVWNHRFVKSSCYAENLVCKKTLKTGVIELNVDKCFSCKESEMVWEAFSKYVIKLIEREVDKEMLLLLSNYWLQFLKFERRYKELEDAVENCELVVVKNTVKLSGRALGHPWELSLHFSRFSEKYNLIDLVFGQLF